jgi:ectoine hydroxylase-related dioxygenase (phytanoyl-CoA dioxygenase family)
MTQPQARTDLPVTKALTAAEHEELHRRYAEDGYVVLKNVVAREKMSALCSAINEAFHRAKSSGGLFKGGGLISGHLNCFPGEQSRFVAETLEERGVVDFVKAVTPRPFVGPAVRCNVNLPKSVAQHYHIDGAFAEQFTVVNVAAMDTDLVNGAIDLVPGTHRRFYKYWQFALERPYRFATRIPMSCGDVLVRPSTLWHRGMPNRSRTPRPMLGLTYGDLHEKATTDTGDQFRENDGKIAFYENRFRPTRLGRLRERTFVAAPITYASYRFVASLLGKAP